MQAEEELRFLILGAQREGNRILASLLTPHGLTPSQAEVLRCLAESGPLSLNALGHRLVCESGSPSRLVSTMVDRGWLVRKEDPEDRRRIVLSLTTEGAHLAQTVHAIEQQLYRWIDQRLDPAAMATLIQGLRTLLKDTAAGRAIEERKNLSSP